MLQPRGDRWTWAWIALIVLVAFGSLCTAEFSSLDDPQNIWDNPRLNPPTLQSLKFYWTHQEQGLYVPLTYTVWAGLAIVARVSPDNWGIGLNSWVYHSANVALHVGSALVVLAILSRLLVDRRSAFIGTLFYAIHPLQVEAVGWAAGLKDVLAGFLGLLSVWQYICFTQCRLEEKPGTAYYARGLLFFVMAMLAKPSALMIPFVAGAMDVVLLRHSIREAARALWPWIALAVVCAIIGKLSQPAIGVPPAPLWARPLVVGDSLAFYFWKIVWPFNLAVDYGRRPVEAMQSFWFFVAWIVPLVLFVAAWVVRKRWPELLAGLLILILAPLPVLGLVTFLYQFFSTTADHYLYVAMLGPALAVGSLIAVAKDARLNAAVSVLLVILGFTTIMQSRVWEDDMTLFSHTLEVNPRSVVALGNLAHAYEMRGDPLRGVDLLRKAVEVNPEYAENFASLAGLLEVVNRPGEAIPYRQRALELVIARPAGMSRDVASSHAALGRDYLAIGKLNEARDQLQKAVDLRPDDATLVGELKRVEDRLDRANNSAMTQPTDPPSTHPQ